MGEERLEESAQQRVLPAGGDLIHRRVDVRHGALRQRLDLH